MNVVAALIVLTIVLVQLYAAERVLGVDPTKVAAFVALWGVVYLLVRREE